MNVLAIIYEGFEELEATAPFALLRRANINLTIASNQTTVLGSHHIALTNITLLQDVSYPEYDALLIPGGSHYKALSKDPMVLNIIRYFMDQQKVVACICAAPTILGKLGYLVGKNYTCYTSLNQDFNGKYQTEGVVVDGNLITAKSAAYSIDFAYEIIRKLIGDDGLSSVQKQIYYEK